MAEPLGDLVRTHYCGELREDDVGRTVTLMGWVATRRDLGGSSSSTCATAQACPRWCSARGLEGAHGGGRPRALGVRDRGEREVAARSADTVNPNLATGEIEVLAREIRVLSEAKTPVFPIEDETSTPARRSASSTATSTCAGRAMQRNIRLRHQAVIEVRATTSTSRASSRSRRRCSGKSTPEGPATSCVPVACTRGASTPCRSRRSCSSRS